MIYSLCTNQLRALVFSPTEKKPETATHDKVISVNLNLHAVS